MENSSNRVSRTISGLIWMLSGNGMNQALSLLFSIILARILVPDDFAAIALILAVTAILQVIADFGISVAIVQRPEIDKKLLDSAFFLNITFFSVMSILIIMISDPFSKYYNLMLLVPLMNIAAITFWLDGLSSFYRVLLLRDINFRAISIIKMVSTIGYGSVAIGFAMLDYGAFSIMWGKLFASLITLTFLFVIKRYIPKSLGSIREVGKLFQFGVWVVIGRVLGQSSSQFDRLLIGKILPSQALGGYYMAQRLTTTLPNLLTSTIDQVMFPMYSNAKNDPSIIERGYWKGLSVSSIIFLPITSIIAAFAKPLIWILLGEKWLYIVPIVQILSIFAATQTLGGGLFSSVIYASNMPQLNPLVNTFRILFLPLFIWIGSRWNIEGIAWGIVTFGLSARIFNQILLKRYLNYSFIKYINVIMKPIVANIGIFGIGLVLSNFIDLGNILEGIALSAIGIIALLMVYLIIIKIIMSDDFNYIYIHIIKIVRQKIRRNSFG